MEEAKRRWKMLDVGKAIFDVESMPTRLAKCENDYS